MATPHFQWDNNAARFRAVGGRFVSPREVKDALNTYLSAKGEELRGYGIQLQNREISIAQFQKIMEAELPKIYLNAGALAYGGNRQLGDEQLKVIGAELQSQFKFLEGLSINAELGLKLDGHFLNSCRQYALSARGHYETVRGQVEEGRGMDEERSIRGKSDSCPDCVFWENAGWQKRGTVPVPGGSERQCRGNCGCTLEYRKSPKAKGAKSNEDD